ASPRPAWHRWRRRNRQARGPIANRARIRPPSMPGIRAGVACLRFALLLVWPFLRPLPNPLILIVSVTGNSLMAAVHILGIETSCDETAAAVVRSGEHTASNVVL